MELNDFSEPLNYRWDDLKILFDPRLIKLCKKDRIANIMEKIKVNAPFIFQFYLCMGLIYQARLFVGKILKCVFDELITCKKMNQPLTIYLCGR